MPTLRWYHQWPTFAGTRLVPCSIYLISEFDIPILQLKYFYSLLLEIPLFTNYFCLSWCPIKFFEDQYDIYHLLSHILIKLRRNIRVSEQTFRGIGDLYNLFERDIDLNFTLEYRPRNSIQRWNKRSSRQNSWRKTIFIIIDAKHNPQCTSSTRGPYSTNCCVPWKRHLLSTHVMNMSQWKSQCQGQKEYIIFQKKILQKPERRWSLGTTTIYIYGARQKNSLL